MNVACGTEVPRKTEEGKREERKEIKDVAAAWIFLYRPFSPRHHFAAMVNVGNALMAVCR